jgi:hypothetical protein
MGLWLKEEISNSIMEKEERVFMKVKILKMKISYIDILKEECYLWLIKDQTPMGVSFLLLLKNYLN